jgi:hypothetical protein
MIWLFENNLPDTVPDKRSLACVLAALNVGGMVLARTVDDKTLSDTVRTATRDFAIASVA